jgi:amino acid adenylation domain-containing protein
LTDPADLAVELPGDLPRTPVRGGGRRSVRRELDGEAIRRAAARLGIEPGAVFLGALGLAVARRAGVAAVPAVAGEVPVRLAVDDDATAGAHLAAVAASLPPGAAAFGAGDLAVRVDAGGVELSVAEEVWLPEELEAFAGDYIATVEALAAAPDARLEDVRGLSPASRRTLEALNDTARPLPPDTVDALFREQAGRTPDAIAVRADDGTATYAQLAAAAAAQAARLAGAGVRPGEPVVVCLDRSLAEIVALLGVLWAGAAYVGVDARQPEARIQRIVTQLRAAGGRLRIGGAGAPGWDGLSGVPSWEPSWAPVDLPPAPADPERTAYVAFTSGSTGEPKGILVPHRAVVRLALGLDYAPMGPGDRLLRFSAPSFDATTFEVWCALLNGAALEVHPPGLASPSELGAFLADRGVTVAWLTSGLFTLVAEHAADALGGLHHLATGGDVVSPQHVAHLLRRHPGMTVVNGYGPTENTTFTTVHPVSRLEDVEDPLPIGRPIANTTIHVLDGRGRLVPPGGVGELYTGGLGLASGYLGGAGADAFGRLSPDVPERLYRTGDLVRLDARGRLRFLGRRDGQVKVRGFRVELEEIRRALLDHPGVRDAIVVATGDSRDRRLVAVVVPAEAPEPGRLAEHLAARLPDYMVPSLWTAVDELPVTANGKIDREALVARARPLPAPAEAEAATGVRAEVEAIVAEVLGFDVPAGADDFFAMGGDSLRAFEIMGLVEERLGVAASLRDFLLEPTLTSLVEAVERERAG